MTDLKGGIACSTECGCMMAGVSVLHLEFTVRALDTLAFGDQPGSALRGALFEALAAKFCGVGFAEATPEHQAACPVCRLLAAEDERAGRGRNLPRPLTVEPPLGATHFAAGATFRFGISLIGWAESALLYILRAVAMLGRTGVGRGRGRFEVISVKEVSPVEGVDRLLLDGRVVRRPQLAVTPAAVGDAAARWQAPHRIRLELLTPMRLTSEGRLVKQANPLVLMQRLSERCQSLAEHYSVAGLDSPPAPREQWLQFYNSLGALTRHVQVLEDDTYWVEARSGSRRQQRYTEIGGLVGTVVLEGDLAPLLPWLLWGQSLHVGKDAVKGNGWYVVR